jgi:glycosyltransferase involved in cell wall biosynthesis
MSNPVVSVLMPVFNVEKYIAQAIHSILQQSFLDFELIILNDGSTDGTSKIIDQFQDHRIQRIDLTENRGLVNARNQLVTAARGRYIAFLDADDIAMPHRLSTQIAFLDGDTVDICGSAYYSLYEASGKIKTSKQRYSDADIRALMTVSSPLCNPAVMGRAVVFKKFPYPLGRDYAEDYSLWAELSLAGYRFANLREKLITYRIHEKQTSQVQNTETNLIFSKSREHYLLGLGISEKWIPRPMGFVDRVNIAVPFLMQLNQKILGISVLANYEIYARFQYRGNGILTPFTRLERLIFSVLASLKGRL